MKQLIYSDFLLGTYPDTRLAKFTGKNVGFIWRRRTRLGIPSYSSRYGYLPRNGYDITVFDEINSVSAYWLGFYFADGCVCKTGNRKLVCFSVSDYEVLKKLTKFYKVDDCLITTIIKDNGDLHFCLQLCNAHLFDRLVSLGCIPRKSLILYNPNIDKQYFLPFLMGFYDGDGGLSKNCSINSWKAEIGTGGKIIFDWIVHQINQFGLAHSIEERIIKSGLFYIVTLNGLSAKVFLSKLYSSVPAGLPLLRKKNLYEILNKIDFRKGPNFFDWEIGYIHQEKNDIKCAALIAADSRNYGWKRSKDSLRKKRKVLDRNLL